MKKQLFTILCIAVYYNTIFAQCDRNTDFGTTINEFNWQETTFKLFVKEDNSNIVAVEAPSPFHAGNSSSQENVDFLSFPIIKDYQVEDGWEAIYVNFGTEQLGVAEPSFGLYNRYDGKVRFFFWLTANEGSAFNSAMLKTRHYFLTEQLNSALFENINSPANALDNFEKKLRIERHNAYSVIF